MTGRRRALHEHQPDGHQSDKHRDATKDLKDLATAYGVLIDKADVLSRRLQAATDPESFTEAEVDAAILDLLETLRDRADAEGLPPVPDE